MVYSAWLFGLGALFAIVERLFPRHAHGPFRRGIGSDLFYLVFNSEYLGVLIGTASLQILALFDKAPIMAKLREHVFLGAMQGQPFWLQFIVLLLVFDFAQWLIHNSLHRVPWLWEFHKVHHSIVDMDWIGNWRFHWFEIVVYRMWLYVPAAFFGFSASSMLWYGVLSTAVGHFAHANMRVRIGPLKYVLNSPEMHIWHHTHPESGPMNRNFGITLSVWDWLFRKAYVPAGHDPERLGFAGIESYPKTPFGQVFAPFWRGRA